MKLYAIEKGYSKTQILEHPFFSVLYSSPIILLIMML